LAIKNLRCRTEFSKCFLLELVKGIEFMVNSPEISMRAKNRNLKWICAVGLKITLTSGGLGAVFSMDFGAASQVTGFDPTYNDGESAVFQGRTLASDLVSTIRGWNYGDDAAGPQRWGLLDNSLPWNQQTPGILVREGFEPSAIGSTTSTLLGISTPASRIDFALGRTGGGEVLFENITLLLSPNSTLFVDSHAWAATSADGFQQAYPLNAAPVLGQNVQFTLAGMRYQGTQPLQIRLYGILGADEGTLPLLRISGDYQAIPEMEPRWLVLLVAGFLLILRRRHTAWGK
jgi:hypothetical protein